MSHDELFLDANDVPDAHAASSYASHADSSAVAADASLQLRVLQGLHRGAETPLAVGDNCLIGSDPSCNVVLCDADVAAKHCLISVGKSGVICRTLEPIQLDGRDVAAGQVVSLENFQSLQCGQAALSIGPGDVDWPAISSAATRQRRKTGAAISFACVMVAVLGLLGISYNALSERASDAGPTRLANAEIWLKKVAPADSELNVRLESNNYLLVSGYVATTYQRELLVAAANDSSVKPRIEVYATEEMTSSLLRLARLERVACTPKYKGGGEIACTNGVTPAAADKLEAIAKQIPGLTALEVSADSEATASIAPDATQVPLLVAPGKISRKFSVLIAKKKSYLIDENGVKYAEGDDFDGFMVSSIELDQVIFKREGQQYAFYVASMGAM